MIIHQLLHQFKALLATISFPHPIQNCHPVVTRGKASNKVLNVLYVAILSVLGCFKEATLVPKWQASMKIEYDAFIKNGTWELV